MMCDFNVFKGESEHRIFKIPVGTMSRTEAEATLHKLMRNYQGVQGDENPGELSITPTNQEPDVWIPTT